MRINSFRISAIARKTLTDLTGWERVIGFIVLGLSLPTLAAIGWRGSLGSLSVQMQTYYVVCNYMTMSVVWIAGLLLAFFVATNGAASVSREASEGTLLILVSKPVARRQIILGKFIAIVISGLLLEAITLLLFALILRFMLPIGMETLIGIVSAIPWILAYSLLVIVLFGSVAVALSTLVRSQIKVMVAVMVVVAAVLGAGSVCHALGLAHGVYVEYHLYLIDGAYHLGNAFAPALAHATGGDLLPPSQLPLLSSLTGIFAGGRGAVGSAVGLPASEWFSSPGQLANHVSPSISIVILVVVSVLALWVAMRAIQRADVH